MKFQKLTITLAATLVLALTAYGKDDPAAAINGAAKSAAATTNAVGSAKAMSSEKIQSYIDKAKGLVDKSKYSDAAASLKKIAGQKLTDAQQKVVDGLKAQIQKAMAGATGSVTNAVGGLLK